MDEVKGRDVIHANSQFFGNRFVGGVYKIVGV